MLQKIMLKSQFPQVFVQRAESQDNIEELRIDMEIRYNHP